MSSHNTICLEKAICWKVSVRVCSLSNPQWKAHEPYCIIICGHSDCTSFFHIIS